MPPEGMRSASSMSQARRLPGGVRGRDMAISNRDFSSALASYLERYPEEAALLSEPVRLLSQGGVFASRRSFPMHVTAGATGEQARHHQRPEPSLTGGERDAD